MKDESLLKSVPKTSSTRGISEIDIESERRGTSPSAARTIGKKTVAAAAVRKHPALGIPPDLKKVLCLVTTRAHVDDRSLTGGAVLICRDHMTPVERFRLLETSINSAHS